MLTSASVREYVERLASGEATPGGGSAAALVGALGAALGEMVGNFTRDKDGWDKVAPSLEELARRHEALLDLTDRDAEAYGSVSAAYALPRGDEMEKAARTAAIQVALRQAAQVPLQVIDHVVATVNELPILLAHGNSNLVSDVGVAADLCQSALRCAWLNVEVNLAYLKDEEYKSRVRQEMQDKIGEAEQTAASVWEQTIDRIVGDQQPGT
ncbi:MAG: cyclodeaminase/cyclohydrolase family protein [Armatimonadia bacterium]